jgi:hypothetical protein
VSRRNLIDSVALSEPITLSGKLQYWLSIHLLEFGDSPADNCVQGKQEHLDEGIGRPGDLGTARA